jgi:GNAT superfamily N-acetyltransferase
MLEIRWATENDAPLILQFVRALAEYERALPAVQVTVDVLKQQLAAANPPFECLIASHDGTEAGFALFFHTYSTWLGRQGIWLEDLFVLPELRRHGVGKALLERVAAVARERECGRLEWSVLDWNQPALDFYASLGAELMSEWRICRVAGAALIEFGDEAAGRVARG